MPGTQVNRELVALVGAVHRVIVAAAQRAAPAEIELRVDDADAIAARLEERVGGSLGSLRRHLAWLRKRHLEEKPELADGDVADLRDRDLAEAVDVVERWIAGGLDAELSAAVAGSWQTHSYDAAVRAAFVALEQRARNVAGAVANDGAAGVVVINRLFSPDGTAIDRIGDDGFLGALSTNEQKGVRELLRGAFMLLRNATAHREIGYSRDEAEDVIHLVNLCLRLLAKWSPASY